MRKLHEHNILDLQIIPSNDMGYLNLRVTSFGNLRTTLDAQSIIENLCRLSNIHKGCRDIHSITETHLNGMDDLNLPNPLLS